MLKLSEILKVTVSVTDDAEYCSHSCMFFRMLGANGRLISTACAAFAPDHVERDTDEGTRISDILIPRHAECLAMFDPDKSYVDINGDDVCYGPGSETSSVSATSDYLSKPKLRIHVDKDQLSLVLSAKPVLSVNEEADGDDGDDDEGALFADEGDREATAEAEDGGVSDADLGLDNSTEAQYPDAPAHKDGRWHWWCSANEKPKDGERVEAYGFEFTTKFKSVTPLTFKGVVIQPMTDDEKLACGIAAYNGHGALLTDPNTHIEIVCWKPQSRVGRPASKAK